MGRICKAECKNVVKLILSCFFHVTIQPQTQLGVFLRFGLALFICYLHISIFFCDHIYAWSLHSREAIFVI